jgi:hypothetical protein
MDTYFSKRIQPTNPIVVDQHESFNQECAICLEQFEPNNSEPELNKVTLECRHSFHWHCMLKCVEYQIIQLQSNSTSTVQKCPICRKRISCRLKNQLVYQQYIISREDYKKAQAQAKKARTQVMKYNIKYKVLKFFKVLNNKDVYDFLVKEEEKLYEMHRFEAISREKKIGIKPSNKFIYGQVVESVTIRLIT